MIADNRDVSHLFEDTEKGQARELIRDIDLILGFQSVHAGCTGGPVFLKKKELSSLTDSDRRIPLPCKGNG